MDETTASTSTDYYDDYANYTMDYPSIMDSPYVRIAGAIAAIFYIVSFVVGIPANLYVLFRMRRLASSDNERYRNGTGIALCSMAAADLCSIVLICAQNVHQMTYTGDYESASTVMAHAMCKGMLFLTHTVTAISIWSWLLLSSLRYLAICHPLYHLRLWRMPYRALAFIITMSALLNLWLLVAIESFPTGCTQVPLLRNSAAPNRLFHIVEAVWSFVIPCVVIIIMDTSVVMKSTSFPRLKRKAAERRKPTAMEEVIKLTRTSSDKIKRRHQKALFKWLAVALICILLNTPENMYRLLTLFAFGSVDEREDPLSLMCRMLAQVLYFSQFAFNAIYLAIFVYDKSCRTRGAHETSIINSYAVHGPRSRRPSHSDPLNSSLISREPGFRESVYREHGYREAGPGMTKDPCSLPLVTSSSSSFNPQGRPTLTIPNPDRNSLITVPSPSHSLPTTPRNPLLLKVFPKESKISDPIEINAVAEVY